MVFKAKTAPVADAIPPKVKERQDEIKALLFQAVRLYVEDNEEARQELMDMLVGSEPEELTS